MAIMFSCKSKESSISVACRTSYQSRTRLEFRKKMRNWNHSIINMSQDDRKRPVFTYSCWFNLTALLLYGEFFEWVYITTFFHKIYNWWLCDFHVISKSFFTFLSLSHQLISMGNLNLLENWKRTNAT
jgi:hypothetical protein